MRSSATLTSWLLKIQVDDNQFCLTKENLKDSIRRLVVTKMAGIAPEIRCEDFLVPLHLTGDYILGLVSDNFGKQSNQQASLLTVTFAFRNLHRTYSRTWL